jgi:hypothetical protein
LAGRPVASGRDDLDFGCVAVRASGRERAPDRRYEQLFAACRRSGDPDEIHASQRHKRYGIAQIRRHAIGQHC